MNALSYKIAIALLYLVSVGFMYTGLRAPYKHVSSARSRGLALVVGIMGLMQVAAATWAMVHGLRNPFEIFRLLTGINFLIAAVIYFRASRLVSG